METEPRDDFNVDDWLVDEDDLYLLIDDIDFHSGYDVKAVGKYSLSSLKPIWAYNYFTIPFDYFEIFNLAAFMQLSPQKSYLGIR